MHGRFLTVGLLVSLAGCGDELLCPDSPVILIQSPQGTLATDGDPVAPGVQVDVRVRTSLAPGTGLALIGRDAASTMVAAGAAVVDAAGDAVFAGVTLPNGRITIEVSSSGSCGTTSDTAIVDVVAGLGCVVTLAQTPTPNDYYDPLPVLSSSQDPQPMTPDFELGVTVTTSPGWDVEVFRTAAGTETSVATTTADATGSAGFQLALPQGAIGLRAECRGPGGAANASPSSRFFVDTLAPSCALTAPLPGSTITPGYDTDGNLGNGVQLLLEGAIGGDDVAGEAATFTIAVAGEAAADVAGTAIGGDGRTTATGTIDPPSTPSSADLAVRARDHAGNTCTATAAYSIVYDGCDIAITAPLGPVSADADGNPANGAQLDVSLQIDPACVGRPVTSDCGLVPLSGTVPPGGALTLRVDMCTTSPCEAEETCTVRLTTSSGVETVVSVHLVYDTIAPDVAVAVVAPPLACGAQVTPAVDQDPATAGVQVVARVTAAGALAHRVQLTNSTGTTTTPAAVDVPITLVPGANELRGLADDAVGNVGTSPACFIILADLAVSFAPPAADGAVNRSDGTVSGNDLTFPLCGSVSTSGATVSVAIDGGAAVPATVSGTTWCRTITVAESPPARTIVVTAAKPPSFGENTLVLTVDLTPPGAVTDLSAITPDRQRIDLTWTAPSDAGQPVDGYVLKSSTVALTDATFDSSGTVLATAGPQPPGTPETFGVFPARTGTPVWFGLATIDDAGNRSVASIAGPVTPVFAQTGALLAGDPAAGNQRLGSALASGRFNDDDVVDLAVSAPTENVGGAAAQSAGIVYVYFGGPGGISATPDVVIQGDVANARFGAGLASVRWTQATRDDLVVGAPGADGGNGKVYVFSGGAGFGTGTLTVTDADRTIGVAAGPNWFSGSSLGDRLDAGRVDDDVVDDLVIAATTGGAGRGGVVVVHGSTVTSTTIALSSVDPGPASGTRATLIEDPAATTGRFFGNYLHVVGRTEGAADATDDFVVGYADDATVGDWVYVFRPDGAQPTSPGITTDSFVIGRDVRIELVNTNGITEFGSQATTIADQNGDGARDLVIAAHRATGGGQVLIIDGDTVGTGGVAQTSAPGVTLTAISSGSGTIVRVGAVIAKTGVGIDPDVNGDGLEDLLVGGLAGPGGQLYVWFGGEIPTGAVTVTSAHYTITAPALFSFSPPNGRGPTGHAIWLDDVDGDGIDDLAWSSPNSNSRDGSFEILFD